MDVIRLYWKHAAAASIGERHGVGEKDLKALAPAIKAITKRFADDRKAGRLRYRDLPHDDEAVDAVHKQVEHFRDRCDVLAVLGVGGSVLGAAALQGALNPVTYNVTSDRTRPGPQLFAPGSLDPDHVKALLELCAAKAKKAVVSVASASGDTAQTLVLFALFRDVLQSKLGKKYAENVIVTTGPAGGTLRQMAAAGGYRTLDAPAGVPGRFAALSAAGLFGPALCGVDVDAVLAGARDMDRRAKDADLFANPAALIAAVHHLLLAKGKAASVLVPYSASLFALGDWFKHLWCQSLVPKDAGPKVDGLARITPMVALGGGDRHGPLGPYADGPNDKVFTFCEVDRFGSKLAMPAGVKAVPTLSYLSGSNVQTLIHGEQRAAEHALLQRERPAMTVLFPQVSPETVGQFVYLYQAAAGYWAALAGVDPTAPPGPAAGTVAAAAFMGKDGSADLGTRVATAAKRDGKYMV